MCTFFFFVTLNPRELRFFPFNEEISRTTISRFPAYMFFWWLRRQTTPALSTRGRSRSVSLSCRGLNSGLPIRDAGPMSFEYAIGKWMGGVII